MKCPGITQKTCEILAVGDAVTRKEEMYKMLNYEGALLSPDISWDILTSYRKMPLKLYKYQSFIQTDGRENPYWISNMEGQFHLSLGCEFEDKEDCKPTFKKKTVYKHIDYFLKSIGVDYKRKSEILKELERNLTNDYFDTVISNYQKKIRIGCFTDSSENECMWKKYAYDKTGYCIEYDTSKHKLFQSSTFPVQYRDQPYDCSLTLADLLILWSKNGGDQLTKENLKTFQPIYERILKMAYIPAFIKKNKWSFEHEYRMFLLKQRTSENRVIERFQYLDNNSNLDLSNAISAIYLGERFAENANSDDLIKKIINLCEMKRLKLFQKTDKKGKIENLEIL